jgi:hypothetical protein
VNENFEASHQNRYDFTGESLDVLWGSLWQSCLKTRFAGPEGIVYHEGLPCSLARDYHSSLKMNNLLISSYQSINSFDADEREYLRSNSFAICNHSRLSLHKPLTISSSIHQRIRQARRRLKYATTPRTAIDVTPAIGRRVEEDSSTTRPTYDCFFSTTALAAVPLSSYSFQSIVATRFWYSNTLPHQLDICK